MEYDLIVLGAGAAGLMAAAAAGQLGARVLLLDHADKAGKKILISGGGRCNFTNMGVTAECFLSENPHFCKSALARYTQWDFLALMERYGIAWHEKTLGQLFCDGSARQVVAMLMEECAKGRVTIELSTQIGEIGHSDGQFRVAGAQAPQMIVATGGPSIPKMGATGIAYQIAKRFGLPVVEPRPALVPFTLGPQDQVFRDISGVSCPVTARVGAASFREAALFTHKGLSGPAILQVSSYWSAGEPVVLSLLDNAMEALRESRRRSPRSHLRAALSEHLPNRLAEVLAERITLGKELGNSSDADLQRVATALTELTFLPSGTEGYAKAEVTAGGVSTDALSSRTMEAKAVPGLYVIGEAVDVTGWLGGYNFQWAWSSGWAAATAAAQRGAGAAKT